MKRETEERGENRYRGGKNGGEGGGRGGRGGARRERRVAQQTGQVVRGEWLSMVD